MIGKIIFSFALSVLLTFPTIPKKAMATKPSASEKTAVCKTTENKKYAKLWGYDQEDAYNFGLKIQKYVEKEDLQSLFDLVKGELGFGPRKKSIKGK